MTPMCANAVHWCCLVTITLALAFCPPLIPFWPTGIWRIPGCSDGHKDPLGELETDALLTMALGENCVMTEVLIGGWVSSPFMFHVPAVGSEPLQSTLLNRALRGCIGGLACTMGGGANSQQF